MSLLNKKKSNILYFFKKLCIDESEHFKKQHKKSSKSVFLKKKIKKKGREEPTTYVLTKPKKEKSKNKKPALLDKRKSQKKEKKKKKKKKLETLKEVGTILSKSFSHFHSNLERLYFEGGGEKTCGFYHFSFPLPLSTKHPSHSFFSPNFHLSILFFSILPKFHSTKHTVSYVFKSPQRISRTENKYTCGIRSWHSMEFL